MINSAKPGTHGWLLIDKPEGITSAQVVAKIKRLVGEKVGHAGTLDPLATGILPLALGEATKTAGYVTCADKAYRFSIQWGESRSTEDREGEITAVSDVLPSDDAIKEALSHFAGEIDQIPPQFSAIKVDGKRAYDLARQGQEFELKSRRVHLYSFVCLGSDNGQSTFEVHCSKGTYVRSLSRDLARHLGACGHISMLRRIKLGRFVEADTISLDKCEELVHNADLGKALLPLDRLLDDIPVLSVNSEQAKRLRFGQVIPVTEAIAATQTQTEVRVVFEGSLLAFGVCQGGMLKPKRIINL
ncbi:MAG: tRNA pseudouridine(55) synthase TruB [Alphaproteobacteria bacterium]|nr:tRNA pseudouridine(55) synthase TruB [Alphaproteobacteria bacterium]